MGGISPVKKKISKIQISCFIVENYQVAKFFRYPSIISIFSTPLRLPAHQGPNRLSLRQLLPILTFKLSLQFLRVPR